MDLVFNGQNIRSRDEKLCLTDLWRTAGSDESKRPADWLAQAGPSEFVSYIAGFLNASIAGIIVSERGRDGGTWAHWQVGVAYAKYLSPPLHAYVNDVFRRHMELTGKTTPSIEAFEGLLRRELRPVHEELSRLAKVIDFPSNRRDMKPEDRRTHMRVIEHHHFGRCPCLECEAIILADGIILPNWQEHHQYSKWDNGLYQMLPLNRECHERITRDVVARTRFGQNAWPSYQNLLARLPWVQIPISF